MKLTILAEIAKIDSLIRTIFLETSTIGVRYYPVQRTVLERQMQTVTVLGSEIPVKIAQMEDHEVNVQPEFSACQKAAKRTNRPLREIMQLALEEYRKKP